jgi:hypothetical protein
MNDIQIREMALLKLALLEVVRCIDKCKESDICQGEPTQLDLVNLDKAKAVLCQVWTQHNDRVYPGWDENIPAGPAPKPWNNA